MSTAQKFETRREGRADRRPKSRRTSGRPFSDAAPSTRGVEGRARTCENGPAALGRVSLGVGIRRRAFGGVRGGAAGSSKPAPRCGPPTSRPPATSPLPEMRARNPPCSRGHLC